jgi:hypothetical protein
MSTICRITDHLTLATSFSSSQLACRLIVRHSVTLIGTAPLRRTAFCAASRAGAHVRAHDLAAPRDLLLMAGHYSDLGDAGQCHYHLRLGTDC